MQKRRPFSMQKRPRIAGGAGFLACTLLRREQGRKVESIVPAGLARILITHRRLLFAAPETPVLTRWSGQRFTPQGKFFFRRTALRVKG